MQKYLFFVIALCCCSGTFAQEEGLDTTNTKDCVHLKDLLWIKDSVYGAFKSRKFNDFRVFYPSFRTYKLMIDTSQAGAQSDVTQYAMYNSFWNKLRFQHFKLNKKTLKAGVDWDKTTLDSFYIDTGTSSDITYAYIHWIIKYKAKKKYNYSALFINVKDKWFILGELKYDGMVVEKKKKKKKR
jgi:hypothetical protein